MNEFPAVGEVGMANVQGVEAVSVAVTTVPAVMTIVAVPATVPSAATDSTYPEIVGVVSVGEVLRTTATVPVLEATPVPPLATGNAVVKLKLAALTARPAVKLATETCLVVVLCTIGRTSVPARGVVLAGRALIFESAILLVPLLYDTRTELMRALMAVPAVSCSTDTRRNSIRSVAASVAPVTVKTLSVAALVNVMAADPRLDP